MGLMTEHEKGCCNFLSQTACFGGGAVKGGKGGKGRGNLEICGWKGVEKKDL